MADDGDFGLAFWNSGSGEELSEEEADWNQGCSTEDWSASSKLLHIYRHSKKSFQILRNGVQNPKRLAVKQIVDQHPLQSFKMMNIHPDEASTVPGPNAATVILLVPDHKWSHEEDNGWAPIMHISMPELSVVDNKRMEPMDGINAIHKEGWNLTCSVYLYHMELASSVQTVTAVWHIIPCVLELLASIWKP